MAQNVVKCLSFMSLLQAKMHTATPETLLTLGADLDRGTRPGISPHFLQHCEVRRFFSLIYVGMDVGSKFRVILVYQV